MQRRHLVCMYSCTFWLIFPELLCYVLVSSRVKDVLCVRMWICVCTCMSMCIEARGQPWASFFRSYLLWIFFVVYVFCVYGYFPCMYICTWEGNIRSHVTIVIDGCKAARWALGIELRTTGRAMTTLNCWASPLPTLDFWKRIFSSLELA